MLKRAGTHECNFIFVTVILLQSYFERIQILVIHPDVLLPRCVLTPTGSYLARKMCGTLESSMAAPTNEMLPSWLEELPSGSPGGNVIMTDFVDHNSWEVPRAVIDKNMDTIAPPAGPLEA